MTTATLLSLTPAAAADYILSLTPAAATALRRRLSAVRVDTAGYGDLVEQVGASIARDAAEGTASEQARLDLTYAMAAVWGGARDACLALYAQEAGPLGRVARARMAAVAS